MIAVVAFAGCNNGPDRENELSADQDQVNEPTPPTEFTQRCDEAWNQNDLNSIMVLLSNDVVFLVEGQELSDEQRHQWLLENSGFMKDLKTTSQIDNTTTDLVSQAGTYTHGIQENDSVNYDASFTLIKTLSGTRPKPSMEDKAHAYYPEKSGFSGALV